MIAHTRFRGVVCVPLRRGLQGMAVLDLYLSNPDAAADLRWDRVELAADLIVELLTGMPHDHTGQGTPRWLDNPFVDRRATVWVATGMLNAALHLNTSDALVTLRGYSYGHDQTVDVTAADLIHHRLPLTALTDD